MSNFKYPREIYLQDIGDEVTWCEDDINDPETGIHRVKYFHYSVVETLYYSNVRLIEDAKKRWISVSDRLPRETQKVLALHNNHEIHMWIHSPLLSEMFIRDYTHWMPLPLPPEEAK